MAAGLPDRKPGRLSKIERMLPDQQKQLRAWMHDGLTYAEIAKRAREAFGVSLSSNGLSKYYSKHQREIIGNPHTVEEVPAAIQCSVSSFHRRRRRSRVHVRFVFHVQIQPEILPYDAASQE